MTKKEIQLENNSREKVLKGANLLSDTVTKTLGYRGRTILIESDYGLPFFTKDGVTVAKSISLQDPLESLGCEILKQASNRTVEQAGDGTTTTICIANSIMSEAQNSDNNNISVEIKREIDQIKEEVLTHLKKFSTKIDLNSPLLKDVINISCNNDEELSELIHTAFTLAGENGVVSYEPSDKNHSYVKQTRGLPIDRGISSDLFFDKEKRFVDQKDCLVLVVNREIKSINEISFILKHVLETKNPLLIISDLTEDVKQTLIVNKLRNNLNISHITPPHLEFSDKRKRFMEDIAIATNAQYIDTLSGSFLENRGLDILGIADRVTINKTETVIQINSENQKQVYKKIDDLKQEIRLIEDSGSTVSNLDIDFLRDRISRLSSNIATIKINANSEIELSEILDRVDDAVRATTSSLAEGIVPGGGSTLYLISNFLKGDSVANQIMIKALRSPFNKILENAGVIQNDFKSIHETIGYLVKEKADKDIQGFDVKDYKWCGMKKAGIIDPTLVIRSALENAISVAGQFIMMGGSVTKTQSKN